MQYKTIVLELIRSRPDLHRQLKASKTLLPTVERQAILLKASHEAWIETLRHSQPAMDSTQLSSEALERALKAFEEHLANSAPDESETEFLDKAMASIRQKTPPA
jgi:hypothetical protein